MKKIDEFEEMKKTLGGVRKWVLHLDGDDRLYVARKILEVSDYLQKNIFKLTGE